MLIKLAILLLAVLGLVFVVMPFFNHAVFDMQCQKTGCSGQICEARTIVPSSGMSACDWKPEYGCLKGCKVKNYKCGFDADYEKSCMECLQRCNELEQLQKEICYHGCYNMTN